MSVRAWYLLIHQLPSQPIYLRAKIGRRLSRLGAISLKRSVYVLPRGPEVLEQAEAVLEEIQAAGGHAYLCEADFVEGTTTDALVVRLREARDSDYEALSEEIDRVRGSLAPGGGVRPEPRLLAHLARLRKRFLEIRAIDSFRAPRRKRAEAALTELEKLLSERVKLGGAGAATKLKGRVWVTRRGIQIDRIASAWLIRKFIDARARFRFIDPTEERDSNQLRFDMVGGDFTHEEDRCTFETLVRRFAPNDRALTAVAEIVHDIDIKDGKFGRPEARGIEQLLHGMLAHSPADAERLERGFALFEDLYRSFTHQQVRVPTRNRSNQETR